MSTTGYIQYNMRTVVHSAPGSIIRLPALFEGLGAKRVVLLSDQGLKQVGIVDQVIEVFNNGQHGLGAQLVGVYDEIAADAACETVNAALKYARDVAADAILALGGGSVQDAAKGVKYGLQHSLVDVRDAIQAGIKFESWPKAQHSGIPHIGVPTTAGTGAEVTNGAVLYNEAAGIKGALVVPFMDPDIAVLDANLTLGLPPGLTASTGMDALTHALEGVASPIANHFSDAHCFTSAQLIEKCLPLVVKNGQDLDARNSMLQASSMAVNGFLAAMNAMPVHNCAHAFGALFHIPHGDANAVLLPICMEVLREFYLPSAQRLAAALNMQVSDEEDNGLVLDRVIARVRGIQQEVGCLTDFGRYNIAATDIERIIMAVASDPVAMFFPMTPQQIQQIAVKAIG
ncbi:MAG: iron-containing alcohol dehydrogenase [Motiliproteus sp.]